MFIKKVLCFVLFLLLLIPNVNIITTTVGASDTGWKNPTRYGFQIDEWRYPTNAYTQDDSYAIGLGNRPGCNDESYSHFAFGIGSGATISGIIVSVDAYGNPASSDMSAKLSWNNGTSWTSTKTHYNLPVSDTDTYFEFGGTTDDWGHTWTSSQMSDTSFSLFLTVIDSDLSFIDHVRIKVYYSTNATPTLTFTLDKTGTTSQWDNLDLSPGTDYMQCDFNADDSDGDKTWILINYALKEPPLDPTNDSCMSKRWVNTAGGGDNSSQTNYDWHFADPSNNWKDAPIDMYVKARAWDGTSYSSVISRTFTSGVDETDPSGDINKSSIPDGSTFPDTITGNASDATSGINLNHISIENHTAGTYWTGTAWGAKTELDCTGTTTWSYDSSSIGEPSVMSTYIVILCVKDNAYNIKDNADLESFVITPSGNNAPTMDSFNIDTEPGANAGWDFDNDDAQMDWATTDADADPVTVYITFNKGSTARLPTTADYDYHVQDDDASNKDCNWENHIVEWADYDGAVYVRVIAHDGTDYSSTQINDTLANGIDGTNPTGTVDTYGVENPSSIEGDSADATSGVASNDITIKDTTDSDWWTGSAWGAETWLDCTGTTAWSYDSSGVSWDSGHEITVTLRIYDVAGNVDASADTELFTTNTPPTITGEIPSNDSDGIELTPLLRVLCTDADGDRMNATWWSNSSTSGGSTISYGSEYVFNTGITYSPQPSFLDSTHFVVAYQDASESPQCGNAVIGVVSGDAISFGLEYAFNAESTNSLDASALDSTHFVAVYRDGGNSYHGYACIGTVSNGDEISYGSEYVFNAASTIFLSVDALDSTHFVVIYKDSGNNGKGTACIGTVSGSTISFGSEYVFNTGYTEATSVSSVDSTHFVVSYQDWTNNQKGTACIGTVSGSTISFGSEYVFNTGTTYYTSVSSLDSTHFVVAYQDATAGFLGKAIIGTTTGSSIAFGSEYTFNNANTYYTTVSKLDSLRFVISYKDDGNSDKGTAIIGNRTGSTISYGSEYVFNSAITDSPSVSSVNSTYFVAVYKDGGNSNKGTGIIGTTSGGVNTWAQFASNSSANGFANNTIIRQTNSNFSDYETKYWWSVNLTDGVNWFNKTYHFTTRSSDFLWIDITNTSWALGNVVMGTSTYTNETGVTFIADMDNCTVNTDLKLQITTDGTTWNAATSGNSPASNIYRLNASIDTWVNQFQIVTASATTISSDITAGQNETFDLRFDAPTSSTTGTEQTITTTASLVKH